VVWGVVWADGMRWSGVGVWAAVWGRGGLLLMPLLQVLVVAFLLLLLLLLLYAGIAAASGCAACCVLHSAVDGERVFG
jgi:hypothetical protein